MEMLRTTIFPKQTSVIYFAFDRHDQRRNSSYAMLLSFTRQLLCLQPSLFYCTKDVDPDTRWTSGELKKVLKAIVEHLSAAETILVIDDVDECNISSERLLKDLIILGRDASETTFKVITVSMQPEWPNVKYFPVDLGMVQEIEDDKRRVIETGISRLLRERPALAKYRNELLSKLCTSGTTFSDLCLGLEHLRAPRFASTPALIRKELEILPWSLHGAALGPVRSQFLTRLQSPPRSSRYHALLSASVLVVVLMFLL
jgi:hypothetical protein